MDVLVYYLSSSLIQCFDTFREVQPSMQFNPNSPIWLQVMTDIETHIAAGHIRPGDKLPGGRELALTYSINPNTASRVYQELEKAGLCGTRRGMGTYVTEDTGRIAALRQEMAQNAVREFLKTMEDLGIHRDEIMQYIQKGESEK